MTGMALAHCILGKFLGVVCHCFPPHVEYCSKNNFEKLVHLVGFIIRILLFVLMLKSALLRDVASHW